MNTRLRQRIERISARIPNERTPRQQIDALNNRLGQGVGAKKERERLIGLMVAEDRSVPVEEPLPVEAEIAPIEEPLPVTKRERKRNRRGTA